MTYSSSSIVPLSVSFNRVTCGGSLKFYKAKFAKGATPENKATPAKLSLVCKKLWRHNCYRKGIYTTMDKQSINKQTINNHRDMN